MATLKHQTLFYDSDCPLCQFYSSGFVKMKILDGQGRRAYSEISEKEQNLIDMKRAANEIALMNRKTIQIIYGIDSLIFILGTRFRFIKKLAETKIIYSILKKLYAFISYNRKVIIPSKNNGDNKLNCIPDFNLKYRTLFILVGLTIAFLLLSNIFQAFEWKSSIMPYILALASGQFIFQGLMMIDFDRNLIMEYLGNLTTILIFGSLLAMPVYITHKIFNYSEYIVSLYFFIIGLLMIGEHFRRLKLLGLPSRLNFTWLLYWTVVFLIFQI